MDVTAIDVRSDQSEEIDRDHREEAEQPGLHEEREVARIGCVERGRAEHRLLSLRAPARVAVGDLGRCIPSPPVRRFTTLSCAFLAALRKLSGCRLGERLVRTARVRPRARTGDDVHRILGVDERDVVEDPEPPIEEERRILASSDERLAELVDRVVHGHVPEPADERQRSSATITARPLPVAYTSNPPTNSTVRKVVARSERYCARKIVRKAAPKEERGEAGGQLPLLEDGNAGDETAEKQKEEDELVGVAAERPDDVVRILARHERRQVEDDDDDELESAECDEQVREAQTRRSGTQTRYATKYSAIGARKSVDEEDDRRRRDRSGFIAVPMAHAAKKGSREVGGPTLRVSATPGSQDSRGGRAPTRAGCR